MLTEGYQVSYTTFRAFASTGDLTDDTGCGLLRNKTDLQDKKVELTVSFGSHLEK